MELQTLDWGIIAAYFLVVVLTGLYFSKSSSKGLSEYFLSGRNMPWWLLGVSMVATTFSADTPNLVTELVRTKGVAGNWGWWAFLITGMFTVFIYARLWRRSMVLTDIEFYELRYGGDKAAFLRGFRALYLGLIFNVVVMGAVALAAVKFGSIMLGWEGWFTLLITGIITISYTTLGGLKAVIITDFVQFILAMIGSIWACIYLVNMPEVGGLANLLANENVSDKLNMLPAFDDPNVYVPVLLMPILVQWWATYYPGAEPGGGGYIAQRMFSAKDEKNAIGATLLFNVAHYALRPWPWILIAFASLVVFPEVSMMADKFPSLSEGKIGHDIGYPAMLTFLPPGLLGLVAASLIAAFMSTMSTQINLGSSYLVNDFYARFINKTASESQNIKMAKLFTLVSAALGFGLGLFLESAEEAFTILLLLGSGTGLIYLLRWFWWRINAISEIVAMVSSLVIASYFTFADHSFEGYQTILIGAILTSAIWIITALATTPEKDDVLINFIQRINPGGVGWLKIRNKAAARDISLPAKTTSFPIQFLCVCLGLIVIYAALFATGNFIYGNNTLAFTQAGISAFFAVLLFWFYE